jgi:hypothetical protein
MKPLYAPEYWHLDWERMRRPGIVDVQFRIFTDYAKHVARFPEISAYHREHQPRSLLLGTTRYFEVDEVLAYSRELDQLDMHIWTERTSCLRRTRNVPLLCANLF